MLLEGSFTGKKAKGGGFQTMGLSSDILRGVEKRGYRVPTPIQRRVIPEAMTGSDIVCMSRTGSGKTAAFLVPTLTKLGRHQTMMGARAIIISPTRDLAIQTAKFASSIGKFTDLRFCTLLGGDSMNEQFETLAGNPDLIIATPGRLVHILDITKISLSSIQIVIFDEADVLFEMGFQTQLHTLLKKLPESKQVMLVSATMPRALAEFSNAGLTNPRILRLDLEATLSSNLDINYLLVRPNEKQSALLWLLRTAIAKDELTIVFACTKYHVEYLHKLSTLSGIPSTYIFGSMDAFARKDHLAEFTAAETVKVCFVTDVAARGLDLPLLNNVIHYDFPANPKLFVHRSGRVARAGRKGRAIAFLVPDELGFAMDLKVFLGEDDLKIGRYPTRLLESEMSCSANLGSEQSMLATELDSLLKVCVRAFGMYCKTRPGASPAGIRMAKKFGIDSVPVHDMFAEYFDVEQETQELAVKNLSSFRPSKNIFEIGGHNLMMKAKRRTHYMAGKDENWVTSNVREPSETVIDGKEDVPIIRARKNYQDPEFFVTMTPSKEAMKERGLEMERLALEDSVLDLEGEDNSSMAVKKSRRVWDARKRKYVNALDKKAGSRQKTNESGGRVGHKNRDAYKDWKNKTRQSIPLSGSEEVGGKVVRLSDGVVPRAGRFKHGGGRGGIPGHKTQKSGTTRRVRSEIKTPGQMLKKQKLVHGQRERASRKPSRK